MPAAVKNPHAAEVGARFRAVRERLDWTLVDVERESQRRWGEEGTLRKAQVSRIENGNFGRLTMDDAVRMGLLYGMTPNQVAEFLGLYHEPDQSRLPPTFHDLVNVWPTLSIAVQEDILSWMELALLRAKADKRKKKPPDTNPK